MKKIFSLLLLSLISITVSAQTNPNRMLVRGSLGEVKGFLIERIDSVFFASDDRRIAADVVVNKYNSGTTGDTIWTTVTRTPGCEAFRIACMPANRANALSSDAIVASYMESTGDPQYFQDFTNGQMTGFPEKFKDDSEYALITIGYDSYGIACSASKATFRTPKKPLVGSPAVTWAIDNVSSTDFTMSFTPNADVAGYATVMFNAGEAEAQFTQFGPMFGFANMGDMIKAWGIVKTETSSNTWSDLAPNKDYEVYIQCWDANGTYADMIVAPVTTRKMGGQGVAEMTISIGEFGGDPISGFYQWVTFTPNDQAGLHRELLIEKKTFDESWDEAKITETLKTEDPTNPYWDNYGIDEDRWGLDASTSYIAFSIAQNINAEWGPLARKDFTTPDGGPIAAKMKAPALPERKTATKGAVAPRKMLNMLKGAGQKASKGITLMP